MDKLTILLVDDHAVVRLGLRTLLEDISWIDIIGEAGNAAEAVESVAIYQPDVVLMDIEMKPINGFDTTNQLRKVRPDGTPPVIAMSAHNASEFEIELQQFGFADFIHKPFNPEVLFKKLSVHINQSNV